MNAKATRATTPKTKPNRQQRRAAERTAARSHATEPVGFQMFFTDDEMKIVEEALALWVHETRQDLKGLTLVPAQEWALGRGETMRQALQAAIEERPYFDVAPQRTAPK